jgi:hypothetical protein
MKSAGEIFTEVQNIINNFDGCFSIKNSKGQYLYANDAWLSFENHKLADFIGKTDEDVLSPENARITSKRDKEAFEKMVPIEYTCSITLNEKPVSFFVIKWVICIIPGQPLFLYTLADLLEKKDHVLKHRKHIDAFFETKIISE